MKKGSSHIKETPSSNGKEYSLINYHRLIPSFKKLIKRLSTMHTIH